MCHTKRERKGACVRGSMCVCEREYVRYSKQTDGFAEHD